MAACLSIFAFSALVSAVSPVAPVFCSIAAVIAAVVAATDPAGDDGCGTDDGCGAGDGGPDDTPAAGSGWATWHVRLP
jgi:hypothetical protein